MSMSGSCPQAAYGPADHVATSIEKVYFAIAQPVQCAGLSLDPSTASRNEERNHADYDAEGFGRPHTVAWARGNNSKRPSGYRRIAERSARTECGARRYLRRPRVDPSRFQTRGFC